MRRDARKPVFGILRLSLTQTGLYSHRNMIDRNCTTRVAKTKTQISGAVTVHMQKSSVLMTTRIIYTIKLFFFFFFFFFNEVLLSDFTVHFTSTTKICKLSATEERTFVLLYHFLVKPFPTTYDTHLALNLQKMSEIRNQSGKNSGIIMSINLATTMLLISCEFYTADPGLFLSYTKSSHSYYAVHVTVLTKHYNA